MLRAAKKLVFESPKLKSYSGLLLSPCININGLIIRADRSMEEQRLYKDFLTAKGAVVHRLKINNELYIGIYGKAFELSCKEIKEFLANNPEFATEQTINLEAIPVANNLINSLNHEYYEHSINTGLKYTDGNEVLYIPPESIIFSNNNITILYNEAKLEEDPHIEPVTLCNTIVSSKNIDAICDYITRHGGKILSGQNIKILANSMICSGKTMPFDRCTEKEIEQMIVGLMDLQVSLNSCFITCKQPAKLANTVISAANTITFSGSAELSIDTNTTWLNNPYRGILPMFKDQNNIRKLAIHNPISSSATLNRFKPSIL